MRRKQRMELVFCLDSITAANALRNAVPAIISAGLQNANWTSDMRPIRLERYPDRLEKRHAPHFGIECDLLAIDSGTVRNARHFIMDLEEKSEPVMDRDLCVEPYTHLETFVSAWVSDIEYYYWQNAEDPLLYTSRGREFSHLPMISNGASYPLNMMVVDTRNNPCRRVIRDGYVEAIGNPMWLGPGFWQFAAHDAETVRQDLGERVRMLNSAMRIQMTAEPFTDVSTEAEQRRLRRLLFG